MAYKTMKKLIVNQKNKLANGTIKEDEYKIWREATLNKLDVFLACNRITSAQYEELVDMMK